MEFNKDITRHRKILNEDSLKIGKGPKSSAVK